MFESTACPDAYILERLVLGQLAEWEAESLAAHLEQCPRCVATVHASRVEDSLVEAARAQADAGDETEEDEVEALIACLADLPWASGRSGQDTAGALPHVRPDPVGLLTPPQGPGELGRLGSHRVIRVLGGGGMGVVFEAEDLSLRRRVALKVLHPALATAPAARERFLREAQITASIKHDHVVTVHQAGEDRGVLFLVMELLEGETLEERLRRAEEVDKERLRVPEALRVARETAEGLAAAHALGLIHRDVKPSNIWLERDGRVKILDFGLARAIHSETSLTDPGTLVGTPSFVAPELLKRDAAVDGRCDLFGLGCVLYRMLTGEMPFRGADKLSTLMAVTTVAPPSPRERNPTVPRGVAELVLCLLAKDPADRPRSAGEAVELLRTAADPAAAPGFRVRPHRTAARRLAIGAACLLAALLASAVLVQIRTSQGTFVLEIADPELALRVNAEGGVVLHDRKAGRVYTLTAGRHRLPTGEYELDVSDDAGVRFSTPRFTLERGGEVKVTASLRRDDAAPGTAPMGDWERHTSGLPTQQQLQAVAAKLKELNAGFDGVLGPRIEDGAVVELGLLTDHLTDLSPVRALPKLHMLVCRGSAPGKGSLTTLAALRGLKLTYLDCSANSRLADLAPLRGMPLRELACWCTGVSDLRPVRGMSLEALDVNWTFVTDLEPVADMPLGRLLLRSNVYSPDPAQLAALPLRELALELNPERHTAVLRSMRTLRTINDQPAARFCDAAEASQADLAAFVNKVATLPPQAQVAAVSAKLRECNPDFDGRLHPKVAGDAVVELRFFSDAVRDLRPLRALKGLRQLFCYGTAPSKGAVFDLWPLEGMPLELLNCSRTNVTDLSPLKKSRLGALICAHTQVRDLSPVRGQRLIYLECTATNVSDLSPLKGTSLLHVHLKGTRVTDLSPLRGMPIAVLSGDFTPERDGAVLRSLKGLEEINGKPAAEFWTERGTGPAARSP